MNKLIILLMSLGLAGIANALVISNSTVSGLTPTSAVVYVQVVSTNGTGTNPVLTCYYDVTDRGTNYAAYVYTNQYGSAGVGSWAVSNQNLSAVTKYYFRWRGVEGTNIALTTPSSNWWTKASLPTSAPPSPAYGSVSAVSTSGVLKWPTNFFSTNISLIASALGAYGYLTNEPLWVAASNSVVYTTTTTYTDTVVKAATAYSVANGLNSRSNTWDGTATTATSAYDIAVGLNSRSNAWDAAAGTLDHTALTNDNGDADVQHLTAAEKAIATNPPSLTALNDATNTLNTSVIALNTATNNLNTGLTALNTATGALDTAVTAVNSATGTLDTARIALNTATNALDTSVIALNSATNTLNAATNTLNSLAANAVTNPVKETVNFNTHSVSNATYFGFSNSSSFRVGQLGGTNGFYFQNVANGSNYWILTP